MRKLLNAMASSSYAPTVNTASITCWVSSSAVSVAHVSSVMEALPTSSSTARSRAASSGDQPCAWAPTVTRATSSSLMPASPARTVCCSQSYSELRTCAIHSASNSRWRVLGRLPRELGDAVRTRHRLVEHLVVGDDVVGQADLGGARRRDAVTGEGVLLGQLETHEQRPGDGAAVGRDEPDHQVGIGQVG